MDQFNGFFHQKTLNPLVSIGHLEEADLSLFDAIDFGMYCVVLIENDFGELIRGGKILGHKMGTVFSLIPGQTIQTKLLRDVRPRGVILAFHPDLLNKTGLGRDFYMFKFFNYDVMDALELSNEEKKILLNCFSTIESELRTPDDNLTGHLLRLGISQLLSYCKRFYERQYAPQLQRESEIVRQLESIVDDYLSSGLPIQNGQPTVAWCASQFHLSANYFGDVIKRELHITAQEYLQRKIITAAVNLLEHTALSVSEVAETLGFTYPNHFTRLFRKRVGSSPSVFRSSKNKIPLNI
ncbi:MAG: helix-turn-helix transcriptional regulator [Bacteroidaceae bacterium]|nr:helix-turn-helix transcriptional regulator [Candidatus Minthousia equi]MCQ2246623.1 helix-turn-helix transcriptional regulator [Bacteroidaceae bacterium]MDO4956511.1 helix-turn-helix transcriptional regulator [Bacteroidales bacterium]